MALLFLRLGATAFGGPAAHVALLEEETVRRRRWVSRQEFLDLLGATNLIPGPNSTEMCIHLGYRRAGLPGLVLGGLCFLLPAAIITAGLAWSYVRWGSLPALHSLLWGLKPVVLAVILAAVGRLGRTALRDGFAAAIAVLALAASLAGASEILVLFGFGFLGMGRVAAFRRGRLGGGGGTAAGAAVLGGSVLACGQAAASTAAGAAAAPASLVGIGTFFLKVGALLYGTGYVLIAFLRNGLVEQLRWLTEGQLLDAVSVGQFTPGPLLSTATFIGYLLAGWAGAAVATLGVFLPSFVFVLLTHRWVARLRASAVLGGFLDGVNAAALGLMGAVVLQLAGPALSDWPARGLFAAAIPAVLLTRVNPTWWLLAGGIVGVAAHALGIVEVS